jgi:hypothetical protein
MGRDRIAIEVVFTYPGIHNIIDLAIIEALVERNGL